MVLVSLVTFCVSCDDDDESGPSSIGFFSSGYDATESDGKLTLGFQLDKPTSSDLTVTLATSGTATEGEDYTLTESSITIAAGETNGSFEVNLIKDIVFEDDETIIVSIASAGGLPVAGTYTINVADDDCDFEWIGNLVGVDVNIDLKSKYQGVGDVTIALDGDTYTVSGLNEDWMFNWWGEEVIESVPVVMTVDQGGAITIEEQYIMTTLYNGNEYPYSIVGSGQVNTCDGTVVINYEMIQDGFEVGAWAHANGYMTDLIFKAVLSPPAL